MIPERRHGRRWPMRRGARAALLLAAAALLGFLAGCSGIAATTEDIAAIGPDPASREVIAAHLSALFPGMLSLLDEIEDRSHPTVLPDGSWPTR